MKYITYPYRVKYNGVYYAPGTKIAVEMPDENKEESAVAIKATAGPQKQTRKKAAKSNASE